MRWGVQSAVACLLVLIGCNRANQPPLPPPATNAFQQLLDTSMNELQLKTEAHQAWGLGTFERWSVDQTEGNLIFTNADGTTAVAPAQIIGSFSPNDNSWLWAWDNPSVVDEMKVNARKVRQYGEEHGFEKLTTRKWIGTEDDAWAMVAVATKLCNAQGAYRGQSGRSYVFMTFGEVKISKSPAVD